LKTLGFRLTQLPHNNRQIGAVRVAKMAGSAFLLGNHYRVASAGVHRQGIGGTKLNTNGAALAPGGMNRHLTARAFTGGSFLRLLGNGRNFGHIHPFACETTFLVE
jgi:hypothetical protein